MNLWKVFDFSMLFFYSFHTLGCNLNVFAWVRRFNQFNRLQTLWLSAFDDSINIVSHCFDWPVWTSVFDGELVFRLRQPEVP